MTATSYLAPGFERVGAAFEEVAASQPQGGLAFSVTVDGKSVVDLWAGDASPGRPWTRDTAVCTMSVAKGLAGLCVAMLSDRGLIDMDKPVATYWPEFGKHGKETATVRHVLLHQAGVLGLPDPAATLGAGASAWIDLDAIAEALAASELAWAPGTQSGYHAVTYGWLLGELVRRTDGRTLGTFLREEVAEPLGVATAIGIDENAFRQLATPYLDGITGGTSQASRVLLARTNERARDPRTYLGMALLSDGSTTVIDRVADLLADPDWLRAEIPSSNGVTSAHDLARVFAVLALGGELEGQRLVSSHTLAAFMEPHGSTRDSVMLSGLNPVLRTLFGSRLKSRHTLGWLSNAPSKGWGPLGPSPRAVGSGGLGGQFAMADPDARLSCAFVRSEYTYDTSAHAKLLKALYSCALD